MIDDNEVIKHEVPYKDNKAIIKREGRWGFYRIYLERGETPTSLKDQLFTTLDLAISEIKNELNRIASKTKAA